MEQYNILMTIFGIIMIILLIGMKQKNRMIQKRFNKVIKENKELSKCLDDLYYLVDCHGGFHDSKGGWGCKGLVNKEIANHYSRFFEIYKRAKDKTSYYYGCGMEDL